MKYMIATLFILASHISYSQTNAGELTPALEKKIKAEVEKSVAKLRNEYAGGGTMQNMVSSSSYLDFVRKRTIEIVEHLRRATQDYN